MPSDRAGDAVQPDSPSFYDRHWEHADTSADPHVVAKGDLLMTMVPADVRTIVDVGCGDGYLTHRLAQRWSVTGVERSAVALAKLRCPTVQASADALPLPDRSADLLLSSEVLEHLPEGVYERALAEMERVAARWLIVSVPYREQLARRQARCPSCRLEFHIDGHLRSFDGEGIDVALPAFERVRTELCGPLERPTYAALERARHRVAKRWYVWDGAKIVCPGCGASGFRPEQRSLRHWVADKALDLATALANRGKRRKPEPYWVIALMRRRERP